MPLSNNIRTYEDVRGVLESAIVNNGLKVEFESIGAATNWRQRASKFRQLIEAEEGDTRFYAFTFRQEDSTVIIDRKGPPVKITKLDGEEVELEDRSELAKQLREDFDI